MLLWNYLPGKSNICIYNQTLGTAEGNLPHADVSILFPTGRHLLFTLSLRQQSLL